MKEKKDIKQKILQRMPLNSAKGIPMSAPDWK